MLEKVDFIVVKITQKIINYLTRACRHLKFMTKICDFDPKGEIGGIWPTHPQFMSIFKILVH